MAASHDTRFLNDPAVSADHIAFGYAGDIWVANRDGTGARRLTTHKGNESRPRFSPDGRLIAFNGQKGLHWMDTQCDAYKDSLK